MHDIVNNNLRLMHLKNEINSFYLSKWDRFISSWR